MTRNSANPKPADLWTAVEHALVKNCAERNCRLLVRKKEAQIVDCAKIKSPAFDRSLPMCDYLAFSPQNKSFLGVVEIKSGSYKVNHVRSQLENGANRALLITKSMRGFKNARMFLVLVRNRSLKRIDEQRLLKPVLVNGLKCKIHACGCGTRLSSVLERSPCLH